jgi:hypothetical protein
MVPFHYGHAPHAFDTHERRQVVQAFAHRNRDRVRGHDLLHGGSPRVLALSRHPQRDVAVRENARKLALLRRD